MNYETSDYREQDAGVGSYQLKGAIEVKAFDRCLGDANIIREQIAEAVKVADSILERLAGPRPENDAAADNQKEPFSGGVLGELSRAQSSSVMYLAGLRRVLENVGRLV